MPNKRGTYDHMLAVAKKKPELQQVIDNISDYTEGQISELSFPKWIRKHLLTAHKRDENDLADKELMTEVNRIAREMTARSQAESKEYTGIYKAYKYNGPDMTVGTNVLFEVVSGDPFLIISDLAFKIGSHVVNLKASDAKNILAYSTLNRECSIGEYNKDILYPHICEKYRTDLIEHDYSFGEIWNRSVRIGKDV